VGSRGGAGQSMTGGDAPRRQHDDGAEEVARDGSVPVGEAAPAAGGGLGVLWSETGVRGDYWCVIAGREEFPAGGGERELGRQRRVPVLKGGRRGRNGGGSGERGRRVEEAGESKGGGRRGVGQRGGVASGGSGPATARVDGALPRDSGGRRGRRDAGRRR
jgi:hypothetical protein